MRKVFLSLSPGRVGSTGSLLILLTSSLSLMFLVGSCAAIQPAYRDNRFIIYNHGNFADQDVQRVRKELYVGLKALEKHLGPISTYQFPVIVNLWPGREISHSRHGQGPIELYRVGEVRAPIIHELTHVLAGYTRSDGQWTPEGFASYMQDKYGEDRAFPTYRISHALVKTIIDAKGLLPMMEVMKDRDRQRYFGKETRWERWLAYTQSTSFCRHLIEKYGMEKFLRLYDKPFEAIDFRKLYGKSPHELVSE